MHSYKGYQVQHVTCGFRDEFWSRSCKVGFCSALVIGLQKETSHKSLLMDIMDMMVFGACLATCDVVTQPTLLARSHYRMRP